MAGDDEVIAGVKYPGVSHQKITTLVHKGLLQVTYDKLVHRVKLVN